NAAPGGTVAGAVSSGAGFNAAPGGTVAGAVSSGVGLKVAPGEGEIVVGAFSPGVGLMVGDASWANTLPDTIPPSRHSAIMPATKTFLNTCSVPSRQTSWANDFHSTSR
ncbi:MAG TPA: hypothetical protein DD990_17720, partial [Cyanobacteria bacterium UBA11368]|nr:hypothetical protein [Cyanobacteria bacterium UBA11368]